MKILRILLTAVVIFSVFGVKTSAVEDADEYLSEFENILPEGFEGIVDDPEALTEAIGLHAVLSEVSAVLVGHRAEILSFFLMLLGVCAVSAISSSVGEKLAQTVSVSVGVVSSVLIFSEIYGLFGAVTDTLGEMRSFFSLLSPIALGITALGGGAATASVQAAGMNLTLSLLDGIGGSLFVAVSGFGFAMSLLSAFGHEGVSSVARGVKNLFTWMLGIFTALFSGTLSLQTMISSATDSAAMRAAKYMASGMIPVVGSTVSGAMSTLASGLSYAKSVVGVGSVLVLVSTALSPLVLLLLYRLSLSLALIFSDFLGASSASRIFSSYRFSLDTLVATYVLSAVIYIFQIILFVKCGVALL